jgi:hypothetical protein
MSFCSCEVRVELFDESMRHINDDDDDRTMVGRKKSVLIVMTQ